MLRPKYMPSYTRDTLLEADLVRRQLSNAANMKHSEVEASMQRLVELVAHADEMANNEPGPETGEA